MAHPGRLVVAMSIVLFGIGAATWGQSAPASAAGEGEGTAAAIEPTPVPRPEIAGRRIVKHFDFDEERFGNYDPFPMNWRRHGAEDFPPYLEGAFDHETGRLAPPSFRLALDGGSIGYHYLGRDISVRTNSDYLILAWIRTEALETARAYITAYFLDRKGAKILGTEHRSALIGGPSAAEEFQPVSIGLPGNVAGARYIGLSVWLTQATVWDTSSRPMRHIEREDVTGEAWFDDITVFRLPRVSLTTANPGNVFVDADPVELLVEVNDPDGLNLRADLEVHSAAGQLIDKRDVPIQADDLIQPTRVVLEKVDAGAYQTTLTVRTAETVLVRQSLRFIRLAATISAPAEVGRGFGIVLNNTDPPLLAGQHALLQALRVELVKLPVWYAQQAVTSGSGYVSGLDPYLEAIVETRADPVGILRDDPSHRASSEGDTVRSMLDLFNESPLGWKPLIAETWSRYAGLIHVWQIGDDDDATVFLDHRLDDLLAILRREMRPLMSEPRLATPITANYTPSVPPVGDYTTLHVPASIPPDDVERHIQPFLGEHPERVWITVEPPQPDRYTREHRLASLSRRLGEAYFQNVGGVFLDAPWDVRLELLRAHVEPREDLIVFRTVADVLGGTTPVSRTTINGQAKCLVFDRNGQAVLMVWDNYAPPEGREHVLLLGPDAEQVDLWGRRSTLTTLTRRQVVRIGPTPTFLVNSPTWLIEFRRQFRIEPALLKASYESNLRDVVFKNTYTGSISGVLRLFAPTDWEVRPNRMPFSLRPGEEFRTQVAIRFPQNAEAGIKPLLGEFTIEAHQRFQITTPAWFELGIENIDMQTFVYRVGSRVIVRQLMTNRTDDPVSFEGYLVVAGRQRINRTFSAFDPGESISRDFILEDADELIGQKARIGIRETQGTRMWNRVVTIP